MGKKIGFFGGSFNPIHFGHLNLAVEVMEKKGFDEILFCPARSNPLKSEGEVSGLHRLNMVNLAIAPFPNFYSLDLELKREGPSYTIDTIRLLIDQEAAKDPSSQIKLILGEDAALELPKWRDAEELIRLAPPVIGLRNSESTCPSTGNHSIDQALKRGGLRINKMDISATQIRERIKEDKPCAHLIPKEVLDYIREFCLYSNT